MKCTVTIHNERVAVTLDAENPSERRMLNAFDGAYDPLCALARRYASEDPTQVQIVMTPSHVPRKETLATEIQGMMAAEAHDRVIKAHVATKKAELATMNERARAELAAP